MQNLSGYQRYDPLKPQRNAQSSHQMNPDPISTGAALKNPFSSLLFIISERNYLSRWRCALILTIGASAFAPRAFRSTSPRVRAARLRPLPFVLQLRT